MDFENYTVESERAEAIRNQLREIREKANVGQIEMLVHELGTEDQESASDEKVPALPGFGKEIKSLLKTYRTGFTEKVTAEIPADAPEGFVPQTSEIQHSVEIRQTDSEIRLLVDNRTLVDFTSLPKADEYLINRVDETRLSLLPAFFASLDEEFKKAKAKKAERQAAWKARFGG
jgi:hypothetical protein